MNEEKKKALQCLKTCKGQIEGIIRMIEDERYCIDISNQIIASQAILKKANKLILKQHMNHCVKSAFLNNDDPEEKIEEIVEILNKLIDK
ncbi:metal-sensing transcriptional repressor [Clostridium fallax]|uniref:Copper-sensing transcriptional repressor CsoR n=1 Tax=Clostridium fallax TaxID=1533 RepID=A0A1M4VC82_9CLOT|nr:metal-sensing transcriptional repressor [Clostridium fallax]SHE66561.1 DNA-binding transcriptional regulator, FrmR family [Clostridium fallax]SQB05787.1 copper-sensing transcriptional repressor CsoR [Clostridium fallax]